MILSFFLYFVIFILNFIFLFILRSISININWKRLRRSVLYYLRLRRIDWSNDTTRRIVLASLVRGAYSLEHERQGKNIESSRWEDFGFELHGSPLVENCDGSYYGAIFKNKYPYHSKSGGKPPKFVVVFRGTLFTTKTITQDLILDAKFVCHRLHTSSRVEDALANVLNVIDLAGHSLGSAISLVVGRELVLKKELGLETFLFNPPIVSSPSESSRVIGLIFKIVITGVLEFVVQQLRVPGEKDDDFNKLSCWNPHLFINESDLICQGYGSYFEQRNMTGHSAIGLIAEAVGRDLEPVHLIPSGNLTITRTCPSHPFKAHTIDQWLEEDLQCRKESYKLNQITQSI